MLVHPQFSPIALELGPLAIRWYGLMYLVAFVLAWTLGRWRIRHGKTALTARDLDDLLFYCVLGVVLGGRLGYVLFYKPAYYLVHPLEILEVWHGGMSFHGGLIGVLLVMALFARKRGLRFLQVGDFVATLVPLGLAAGRLGNFINGELWGRPGTVPWAMVFPQAGDGLARHPSQLYEVGLEGLLLFAIVWLFASKPRPVGQVSAVFLMGYGLFRFLVEYTREPDSFLGVLAAGLSMGQWLSLPMIIAGAAMFVWARRGGDTLAPRRS
ncbi:Prolipoprotein diacylglyceryl transferase [Pigmentiphaga humi]|uniref:Phosphatidylglycerol--prolipoprotein diacylglyceryl transferase n=1 Tax=Pigmentiphaga humi TaxID=2478468 RepID=A0A3P4B282_9BURK|nr:prolipoprotein diacylglyceryl transferase [Pigmentiphaga humi]VCU70162.1 Prolipoprotein diacylglyceryl transferase [Pigmentiphaga humi]